MQMARGDVTSVGKKESEALLALRKEFYRKTIDINSMSKDRRKFNESI